MYWWEELGYPPFEESRGGFPRTGQVVKYYRERTLDGKGNLLWTQKRLAKFLDLTEKTIGQLENQDASLDFDRRQCFCQLFDIPPLLFGIRTPEEVLKLVEKSVGSVDQGEAGSAVAWWVRLGYPEFDVGSDGFFPRTGQVIKYYRVQKMDDHNKPWTQRLLAQTLDLTDQAIWDLENREVGMGGLDRRQFLCDLFAIPSILFGVVTPNEICALVEEKRAVQQPAPAVLSTESRVSHKSLLDLDEYSALLTGYWTTYIADPAQCSMPDVYLHMDALYRELPHVRDGKPLQELLCRYHNFVANVLRDQGEFAIALEHCDKALHFVERLENDQLFSLVLYDWGNVLWEADRLHDALLKFAEVRQYERMLPTNLRGSVLLDIGCVGTLVAKTRDQKREAIALVDRVGSIVRSSWQVEDDPYFLVFNLDRYHLTRGLALMAIGRYQDALNELKLVNIGPEFPRRQALTSLFEAQAQFNLGEYCEAARIASSGLVIAQRVGSEVNITRVMKLLQQFRKSPFRSNSEVARLEYLLNDRLSSLVLDS